MFCGSNSFTKSARLGEANALPVIKMRSIFRIAPSTPIIFASPATSTALIKGNWPLRALVPASQTINPHQTGVRIPANTGATTAPISPDTPPKAPPDDTSYSAPTGGILADINLQVLPGQANQGLLTMDLDDASPNPPGSKVIVFNGAGSSDINLAESALFDGFHAEGTVCVPPVTLAPTSPASGGGGGGGGQGSTAEPGTSAGASPGASPSGQRTLAPGETPSGTPKISTPTATAGSGSGGNKGDGGGTPAWVWVLIALAVVGLPAAGYSAWRYRSRLPWFSGRG